MLIFDRKISLLRAQGFEHANKLDEALEVYLEVWGRHFSVDSVNYLLVGLTILELFIKLNRNDSAANFAQTVFNQISLHGFENHDLILSINIFRLLPVVEQTSTNAQLFFNYLSEQLGVTSEDVMERSKLELLKKNFETRDNG